jgi:hypothetical protein
MADVGSIGFAIMMLIVALTVLTRLLQPCARGTLRDEGRTSGPSRRGSGPAGPSNEINELMLTKP